MFDLFRSREKGMRYLLGTLLSLVAISMVVTLIPGFGDTTQSGSDQKVADICGEPVTMREVQVNLQETLRKGNIPGDLVSIYAPQIINQMVSERAMSCYAKENGISVTDEDVAQSIQRMVPSLFEGGKFVGKEAYAQFLSSNNMTIPEFERRIRAATTLQRLQGAVLDGMVVTPKEVEQEYQTRNEKVTMDVLVITPAKLQSEVKVTDEEVAAEYEKKKTTFKSPETRSFHLLTIDEQKAGESLKAPDEELKRYYDQNLDQFRSQERIKARHILVKTDQKSEAEVAALRKKAEDLLKQLKAGGDFADLAKKNSDDTGSAVRGGDLDWVGRGQFVPEFEKAAFELQPNQISDIIKTTYGFHIIQLQGKEAARLRPFEEVKDQIMKDRLKEKVYDQMTRLADESRAALVKNPGDGAQIAQRLGMNYVKVDGANRGSALPLIGTSPELSGAVFDLKGPGAVSDVIQVPGNKLAVASLTSVMPERPATFEEVKAQIRSSLVMERGQKLIDQRAQQVFEQVKAAGGDLAKVAAAGGYEFKKVPEFGRDGAAEGIGAAQYVEEAFRRDVGAVFGPVSSNNNKYICKVTAKVPADMVKFADQRQEVLQRVKQRKTQERKDLFEDGIVQYLQGKGKIKINQDAIKRITDSFRNG